MKKHKMSLQTITSFKKLEDLRSTVETQTIGFVPTMGFLHEGHLSLVRKAKEENDKVFVSIFVNPTQFGPKEDLSRYPKDLNRDYALLKTLGVDAIFTPSVKDMYPDGFQTYIEPNGRIANEVEGAIRPNHFRGVATIVLKLFNIVKPTNAYFGQKDAQQALIIYRLIKDLNLDIKLNVLPIIREKDGLAMSSRNAYLNEEERKAASILYRSLLQAKHLVNDSYIHKHIKTYIEKEPLVQLEYFEIRDPETFVPLKKLKAPALLLIAAKVGSTRLIDNFLLREDNTWDTGVII